MIELLILFELSRKTLTMYGISKEIKLLFSVFTTPSYGTIKPALNRLEKSGFVRVQKTMSSGGRPSTYYSITKEGEAELKNLILSQPLDNPIQFMTASRIKLACADILTGQEQQRLFNLLKPKAEMLLMEAKNKQENQNLSYYQELVFNNMICEYKNFISLLEGFRHVCAD